jgi:hypothetical protein
MKFNKIRCASHSAAAFALLLSTSALNAQGLQSHSAIPGGALVTVDDRTGLASFVRMPLSGASRLSPTVTNTGAGAGQRASAFLQIYGAVFGLSDLNSQLRSAVTRRDSQARSM